MRSQRSEALPGFALRRDDGSGGDGRTTPCHSGTNDVPGKRRKKHRLQSSLLRYITTKTWVKYGYVWNAFLIRNGFLCSCQASGLHVAHRKRIRTELIFHNLQRPRLRAALAAKLPSLRSKLKAQGWSRGAAQHYAGLAMRTLSHFMVASRIAALWKGWLSPGLA